MTRTPVAHPSAGAMPNENRSLECRRSIHQSGNRRPNALVPPPDLRLRSSPSKAPDMSFHPVCLRLIGRDDLHDTYEEPIPLAVPDDSHFGPMDSGADVVATRIKMPGNQTA